MVRLLHRRLESTSFKTVRDTVSSVGFGRGDVCLSASSAATHACHIRHALALDECRVKFIPEYFVEMNLPDLRKPVKDSQPQSNNVEASNENELGNTDGPEMIIDDLPSTPTGEESRNISNDNIILEDGNDTTTEKAQPRVVNAISCTQSSTDECTDRKTADIKEVWFAGSHSDVYVHVTSPCNPRSS